MESRLLGFPCFPYFVNSTACFGSAFHKVTITAKAFQNRNQLSESATIRPRGWPRIEARFVGLQSGSLSLQASRRWNEPTSK